MQISNDIFSIRFLWWFKIIVGLFWFLDLCANIKLYWWVLHYWIFVQISNHICRCLAASSNSCHCSPDWICHWAHDEDKDVFCFCIFIFCICILCICTCILRRKNSLRYFEALWGTSRYFEELLVTFRYCEVLLENLRYLKVLKVSFGTLRYF